MISAKLLKSLAPTGDSPGTRRIRIRSEEHLRPGYILGGGISKLPFVHSLAETPGLWTVRFMLDGYSFRLGLKNRILAGFVARLIHAAADPEMFEKNFGVNQYCEWPAPETEYRAHRASVFKLKMPDGEETDSGYPDTLIVDDWVADKMRGYPWFVCNQKGLPDSWAIRPVVKVRRDRRSITVSWVTIESVIFPRRVKPLKKRVPAREVGFTRDGGMYADLRTGKYPGGLVFRQSMLESPNLGRKKKKKDDVIAPFNPVRGLPREGNVTLQKTLSRCFSVVVDEEVERARQTRSRIVSYKSKLA